MTKATQIVTLLHSIRVAELDHSGELVVWFNAPADLTRTDPWSIQEFRAGSFTRRLLQLIEDELHR